MTIINDLVLVLNKEFRMIRLEIILLAFQIPVLQRTTFTERSELIKSSFGIIGTILGVVIGYILASYSKWRESKRRIRNIRRLIFTELCENYANLTAWMPKDINNKHQTQFTAEKLKRFELLREPVPRTF